MGINDERRKEILQFGFSAGLCRNENMSIIRDKDCWNRDRPNATDQPEKRLYDHIFVPDEGNERPGSVEEGPIRKQRETAVDSSEGMGASERNHIRIPIGT
jgi:hypothetical protein